LGVPLPRQLTPCGDRGCAVRGYKRHIINGKAASTDRQSAIRGAPANANRVDTTIRLLVAGGCLLIALLYGWQTFTDWEAVEREAARQTVNLAESLAQQTSSSLELVDSVLQRMQFWATLRGVRPPQRELLRELLRVRTPSMRPIRELAFFDAAGTAVVRSGAAPSAAIAAAERRALAYHATHASLDPIVFSPESATRSDDVLTVSRRFDDHRGRFAGIVTATIGVASLRPLFNAIDVGRAGAISLLASNGAIVLRRPFGHVFPQNAHWNGDIATRARAADAGSFTARSPVDGQNRLVAFQRVAAFPLVVAVGFSTTETFAAWRVASVLGLLGVCGGIVTIVLLARALLAQLAGNVRAQAQLSLFASRDGLTGLFNRREFDIAIEREWIAGLRDATPVSLLMLDVDSFKAYNDRYGHQLGDVVLRQIANQLRERCGRPRDVVARYGGEEFVALLPATSLEGARYLADHVRNDVVALHIEHEAAEHAVVTISLGVAAVIPARDGSPADLIRTADVLLYEAKRSGRNRVMSREGTTVSPPV
jgi:diguanylate cyclase (GGDEF)-like protein